MRCSARIGIVDDYHFPHKLLVNIALNLKKLGFDVFFINPSMQNRLMFLDKLDINYIVPERNINQVSLDDIAEIDKKELARKALGLSERGLYSQKFYYKRLVRQFVNLYRLLSNDRCDLILFWNGAYNCETIIAKKLGIKSVYLEQGYLPSTLQIGVNGINKDIEYSDLDFDCFMNTDFTRPFHDIKIDIYDLDRYINLWSRLYVRLRFIIYPVEMIEKLYFDIEAIRKRIYLFGSRRLSNEDVVLPDKFIFIPLQVHDDTQIVFNSPYIKKMEDIFDFHYSEIISVFPDHKIVVKEHPEDLFRKTYKHLRKKYNDIIWLRRFDFEKLVDRCDIMITVNSSCGFQALSKYKKVMTLGYSFYNNNPFVECSLQREHFKDKLERLKHKKLNQSDIDEYIRKFRDELFISGKVFNFTEETLRQVIGFINDEL